MSTTTLSVPRVMPLWHGAALAGGLVAGRCLAGRGDASTTPDKREAEAIAQQLFHLQAQRFETPSRRKRRWPRWPSSGSYHQVAVLAS